jgi:hypothetical protein
MTLAHFQSLSSSKKPFQLTQDQLIYITAGNKIPIEQIISIHDDQKSKKLDREQLCSLISQNNYSSHVIPHRICLNVEQIIVLAKYSDIKLDQLTTCTKEHANVSKTNQYIIFCSYLILFLDGRISFQTRTISYAMGFEYFIR